MVSFEIFNSRVPNLALKPANEEGKPSLGGARARKFFFIISTLFFGEIVKWIAQVLCTFCGFNFNWNAERLAAVTRENASCTHKQIRVWNAPEDYQPVRPTLPSIYYSIAPGIKRSISEIFNLSISRNELSCQLNFKISRVDRFLDRYHRAIIQ